MIDISFTANLTYLLLCLIKLDKNGVNGSKKLRYSKTVKTHAFVKRKMFMNHQTSKAIMIFSTFHELLL